MGYHGLGAFLHDVIKKEEDIDLDMGDSNGFILGIAPNLPWYYSENIRNLTNDKFCALIADYVKRISDHVLLSRCGTARMIKLYFSLKYSGTCYELIC